MLSDLKRLLAEIRPHLQRYGFAVLAVAIALLIKLLLDSLIVEETPFLLFFAAIVASALYGGLGPGILATTLAALTTDYFFLTPIYAISTHHWGQIFRLSIFIIEGLLISKLIAGIKNAQRSFQLSQEALSESEERYRLLVDVVQDYAIFMLDANGCVASWNQGAQSIIGYQAGEIIGDHFSRFYAEEDIQCSKPEHQLNKAAAAGRVEDEGWRVRKDGSRFWVNVVITVLKDKAGKVQGFSTVTRDISERKRTEEALQASEERYRAFIEQSSEGIWRFELEKPVSINCLEDEQIQHFYQYGYLAECNNAMAHMYGFACAEEIVGARLTDFLVSSDPQNIEYLSNFIRSKYRLDAAESHEVDQQGESKYFLNNLVGIVENDLLVRAWGSQRDITERKKIEDALRERETRYQLVARATNDAIWDWNLVTNEVEWNEGVETLFGYWLTDVLADATWWYEHIHPDDRERVVCGIRDAINNGEQIWREEYRYLRADQTYASVIDRGLSPMISGGNPVRMIGSVMDVTERKQAEAEREQLLAREQTARIEAEAANRMKDEFLATLSHELRTPLNAMLGWTQLLRTRKFDEKTTARALETIDRNTKSLAQLIEDVLDVSRIITGKLRLNVHLVELVPVIEAAVETVLPAAKAKNIQIQFKLKPSVGSVLGDINRLQQVFWNLLANAIKFTPNEGRVEIRLEVIDSRVQVQVSDTGKGIDAAFLPYVFERFRQADSTTTRTYGGLGLGLAIVRHLVELHGGTVHVESLGLSQGSTFIVNLPLKAVRVKASEPQTVQPAVESVAPTIYPPSLQGLRVLVVDDEVDARDLLTTVLGQYGAEVTAVATVSEALKSLKIFQPDVLVSDIGMPEADGYALIRQVRALAQNQGGGIPAVALTAYARAEDRASALLAGFQLHVPKPVDPLELAVVVANLAERTKEN